jgi:hypothetical protein
MQALVQQQLLETLRKIDRPGTFCASGRLPPILPGLEVAGVGPIALPLEKRRTAALKKRARQAPYGNGTQTLVDTDVRRVWEIDADQITLANPEWRGVLAQAVGAAQSELGLEKLQAHLYKLLLYEPGCFFLPHRDGEKLDRMVATLVIALPSVHKGGELVVRHEGRQATVDFAPQSAFHTQFAAFYADCEHEIRPVTSGFRLALVYNLALAKSRRKITAPSSSQQIAEVARVLGQSRDRGQTPDGAGDAPGPLKLAVLLDHQYSEAGLAFDALKGIDRARADALFAAARQAGWDASLALVTHWQSGSAEPSGDYGYRRYGYDSDDGFEHEMGEVYDESLTAEHFRDQHGNRLAFGRIPLNEEEIVSHSPLSEGEPDREEFEGYTGNAGMTLDRWYRRAAVMLWPAAWRFDVLCEAGVEAAVGGLEQMVKQWKKAGKGQQAALKERCLEFAHRIIAHWPQRESAFGYYPDTGSGAYDEQEYDELDYDELDYDEEACHEEDYADEEDEQNEQADDSSLDEDGPGGRVPAARKAAPRPLHSLLETLGDVSLVAAWIRGVLAKDVCIDPGKTLGDLCKLHGWAMFQNELRELFENTSNETLQRHARLLADLSLRKDKNADRRGLCSQLAQAMMSALERWEEKREKRDWRARVVNRRELLPPLAQALLALDEPELMERLVTNVLERPKEHDLTTVQVPALLNLEAWLKRNVKHSSPALHRWLTAVVEELESRKSRPPQEPADWRRESSTGCDCADCKELSRFLKDASAKTLRLPLAQDRRRHLHQVIDGNKLDTTHVTERRGRPYTLVCTKTKASYERALKAHRVDLDHLAKIRKLLDWHEGLHANPARLEARCDKYQVRDARRADPQQARRVPRHSRSGISSKP